MENTALCYRQFGDPTQVLMLEAATLEHPSPALMRVAMSAAPINPSDLIPITGTYRHRISLPCIAGYEGVGRVAEISGDNDFSIGQRVLPLRAFGTWQRYVDCDPGLAIPVPDDIPDELAARAYINPLAAYLMLRRWPVQDRRVVLTAAGSGCAMILAQWALANGAREIVGIYRSPRHAARLTKLGVIAVSTDDTNKIAAVTRQSDLVFDAVGGLLASTILDCLPADAAFISYGLLSGRAFSSAGLKIQPQRFHVRDHLTTTTPDDWQSWFRVIWSLLRQTALPAVQPFPLTAWREALSHFAESGRATKPLLVMQ